MHCACYFILKIRSKGEILISVSLKLCFHRLSHKLGGLRWGGGTYLLSFQLVQFFNFLLDFIVLNKPWVVLGHCKRCFLSESFSNELMSNVGICWLASSDSFWFSVPIFVGWNVEFFFSILCFYPLSQKVCNVYFRAVIMPKPGGCFSDVSNSVF